MATAKTERKVKEKPPEKPLVRLTFQKYGFPGCCGLGTPNSFTETTVAYDYYSYPYKQKKVPGEFDTREEQAEACVQEMEQWGENDEYYMLQVVLVKEYADGREPQFPYLAEAMLKHGWEITKEWVAPRHGNKLVLYSKVLKDADKQQTGWMDGKEYENDEDEPF